MSSPALPQPAPPRQALTGPALLRPSPALPPSPYLAVPPPQSPFSPVHRVQAFNSSSSLIMKGSSSILSGLQVYQAKEWVLRSWRDVFVDLVQGQLQFLFLSLLAGNPSLLLTCI